MDPERVEALEGRLRGVIDELWALERQLSGPRILSPGADVVSVNAAEQSTVMVERARLYLADWRRQIVLAVAALEQQRRAYEVADSAARA
ncbi:hypothetical protein [Pseudonocardia xishanensis]|uniref:hypothetical protein n=1 Tax=Pseudonocardia xishanensis TaxID=630995 RepID=UPI0031EC7F8F